MKPEMDVYRDEIFGPVLAVVRVDTLAEEFYTRGKVIQGRWPEPKDDEHHRGHMHLRTAV